MLVIRCFLPAFLLLALFPLALGLSSPLYKGFRHVLPEFLLSGLADDVQRLADYEESLPLLADSKRSTHWYPLDGSIRPTTFHELAIETIYHTFMKDDENYENIIGGEYWVQRVSGSGKLPISFHVDKDESVASLKHYLLHPIWSSVFYLTDHGGGTLITNQLSPSGNGYSPQVPQEGVWSFPERNKFILFNGTLLHGVVGDFSPEPSAARPRTTFLINFWRTVPEPPNCSLLPAKTFEMLKSLKKKEVKKLRKKIAQAMKEEPLEEIPLDFVDLTKTRPGQPNQVVKPGKETGIPPHYTFRMGLPGNSAQLVTLPVLNQPGLPESAEEVLGRNYYIYWKNWRKINAKKEVEERKAREERENNQEEAGEEEEEEEEIPPVAPPKAKKSQEKPSRSSAASQLSAARAQKAALKAKWRNAEKEEL